MEEIVDLRQFHIPLEVIKTIVSNVSDRLHDKLYDTVKHRIQLL